MTRRHASRNRGIVRRHTRSQYRPERGIVDTITPVRSRTDAATEPPRSEVWRAPRRLREIEALPEQRGETSPEAREQEDSRLEKPPKLDYEHRMARATPAPEKATPQSVEPKATPTSTARWAPHQSLGNRTRRPLPTLIEDFASGRRPPRRTTKRSVGDRGKTRSMTNWSYNALLDARRQEPQTGESTTAARKPEPAFRKPEHQVGGRRASRPNRLPRGKQRDLGLSPTPWTENTRRSTWRYRTGVGCRSGTGRKRHTRTQQRHSRIAPSATRRTSSVRITRYQTPGSRAGAQQQHPGFTE